MKPGKRRSSWSALLAGVLIGCAGCATGRASVEKHLLADKQHAQLHKAVAELYRVGCPDVLEVRIDDRPELSGTFTVGPTGRIELKDYAPLRVDGRTLPEIARLVARETGTDAQAVQVRVVEFHSQFLVLFGQVIGWQRTVPYQGQETVLDLLRRVGGITPAAQPEDVHVVRTHLATGQRPEVFHVDLEAIVMRQDHRTNVRLLPFDQIYVGETRQARVEKFFPPWLRPAYQAIWNMLPGTRPPAPPELSPRSRWITGPRLSAAEEAGDVRQAGHTEQDDEDSQMTADAP
jgi:protein involved in polysaccharide export with SLBB domain